VFFFKFLKNVDEDLRKKKREDDEKWKKN